MSKHEICGRTLDGGEFTLTDSACERRGVVSMPSAGIRLASEDVWAELDRLRDENARLRAENSRLRGEPTEPTSILDAMNELREASGGAWDHVADPDAYLRGKDSPATGEGGGRGS
jgi:hypothetical protein